MEVDEVELAIEKLVVDEDEVEPVVGVVVDDDDIGGGVDDLDLDLDCCCCC